jgi:atypical dual specificity phosphatase
MSLVKNTRGYVALVLENETHITLLCKEELKKTNFTIQNEYIDTFFIDLGLGSSNGIVYNVIVWPGGDYVRKQLGLPKKHFHITRSSKDAHGIDKSFKTIFEPLCPSVDDINHIVSLLGNCKDYDEQLMFYLYSIQPTEKLFYLLSKGFEKELLLNELIKH